MINKFWVIDTKNDIVDDIDILSVFIFIYIYFDQNKIKIDKNSYKNILI